MGQKSLFVVFEQYEINIRVTFLTLAVCQSDHHSLWNSLIGSRIFPPTGIFPPCTVHLRTWIRWYVVVEYSLITRAAKWDSQTQSRVFYHCLIRFLRRHRWEPGVWSKTHNCWRVSLLWRWQSRKFHHSNIRHTVRYELTHFILSHKRFFM
jgi:hypothetical protein